MSRKIPLDIMILLWYHYRMKSRFITQKVDYGIRALCAIAGKPKELATVAELAQALKVPHPFLRGILQDLNKHGLLRSYKGKLGGFTLGKDPRRIRVIDLINIFQGSLKLGVCVVNKDLCPDIRGCKLRQKLEAAERRVMQELGAVTIQSLL